MFLKEKHHTQSPRVTSLRGNELGHDTGTDRAAALAESKSETDVHGHGVQDVARQRGVIAGHDHLHAVGELHVAGDISRSHEKLGSVGNE